MTKQATPWLRRAIAVSIAVHLAIGAAGRWALPHGAPPPEVIDVEVAPAPAPAEALPEERERKRQDKAQEQAAKQLAAAATTPPRDDGEAIGVPIDAGIDAARPDAAPRDAGIDASRDARIDAAIDAGVDAAPDAAEDAMTVASETGSGSDAGSGSGSDAGSGSVTVADSGSGSGSGSGSVAASGSGSGSGSDTIVAVGSGSGSDVETEPAVEGAPTTAGTAANLLTYFPAGQLVTALVRFDRLRGTEWAAATEQIFKPLPDYQALFGGSAGTLLADKLDMLVISTPQPRDVTATMLVAKTTLSRSALRDVLGGGFAWSASRGGMLGRHTDKMAPNDKRVVLSPFRGWFVVAQPQDLPSLDPARGDLDTIEATAKLPTWLSGIRTIADESGSDARGPALVATFAFTATRYRLPAVVAVTSVPGPVRASLAMELVKTGWLVRGNIKMASEADATELEASIHALQQQVTSSTLLRLFLGRGKAFHAVANLQVARAGDRLSYSTSLSIADARGLLAFVAQTVAEYFKAQPRPP